MDLKAYDVGTRNGNDTRADFDTPTLAELWRTAPYLHDGSAATLRAVLTTRNAGDRHGKTSALAREQLDDLVQYLLELEPPAPERVDLFQTLHSGPWLAPPRDSTSPSRSGRMALPSRSKSSR